MARSVLRLMFDDKYYVNFICSLLFCKLSLPPTSIENERKCDFFPCLSDLIERVWDYFLLFVGFSSFAYGEIHIHSRFIIYAQSDQETFRIIFIRASSVEIK